MAKVYQFMANGTEEVEALTVVDVLRRAGIDIETVSITGTNDITSSHNIIIRCDKTIEEADFSDADMLLLPGGMPGATNLQAHPTVCEALAKHAAAGKKYGAICAAPMVLGGLGLLKGKKATCYPGFEQYLDGADYSEAVYIVDGDVITGCGPAATMPYAYAIVEMLGGDASGLREGMMFNRLMSSK